MFSYRALILSVYDGDTVTAKIDLGFDIWVKKKLRLRGINTPEVRTKDKDEKRAGYEARDLVRDRIQDKMVMVKMGKAGKYGRYIATIFEYDQDGELKEQSLNDELLETGLAKPYGEKW